MSGQACHTAPPAKHAAKGFTRPAQYAYPKCFAYPIGDKQHTANAVGRFKTHAHNIPAADRPAVAKAINAAAKKYGVAPLPADAAKRFGSPSTQHKQSTAPSSTETPMAAKKSATKKKPAKKSPAKKPAKKAAKKAAPVKAAPKAAPKAKKPAKKAAKAKSKAKKAAVPAAAQAKIVKAEVQAAAAKAEAKKAEAALAKEKVKTQEAETKAAKAKAAAKPAKKKPAKKAAKKAAKKKAPKAKAAAAKPKAKKPAKKKPAKKAAKKAAPKAKAAAKKPSKKGAKKPAKKKPSKKGKGVQRSTSLAVSGRKTPASVKAATKGKKLQSAKKTYADKRGNRVTVTHRYSNPVQGGWKNWLVLGSGVAVGAVVANIGDRWVATRAGDARYPWYAADAGKRIMLRPDAIRLLSQAGIGAVLVIGSVALSKKMPGTAYFLAGAAFGVFGHVVVQVVSSRLMPWILSAPKGTERNAGNRLYPFEQDAPQLAEAAAIEAEDKAWKNAPGQQGTDTELPASYANKALPAASTAPATTQGVRRGIKRIGGVGDPAPSQQPGQPRMVYGPALTAGRTPNQVHAAHGQAGAGVGEPVATRRRPAGVGCGVGCGGKACGTCASCCDKQIAEDDSVENGLNVRRAPETITAGPQPGDEPPDTSGAIPRTDIPGTPNRPGSIMPTGPNGRPVGIYPVPRTGLLAGPPSSLLMTNDAKDRGNGRITGTFAGAPSLIN